MLHCEALGPYRRIRRPPQLAQTEPDRPQSLPAPWLHAEEQPEPKRGVHRDWALAIDQLADPARRDINVRSELAGADAHGLHKILQTKQIRHWSLIKTPLEGVAVDSGHSILFESPFDPPR